MMTTVPVTDLNTKVKMPVMGFGVWKAPNDATATMVQEALTAGYRLIDTAKQYGNEAGVGQGITQWQEATGGKRQDIFLTTKIFNGDQQKDYDQLMAAFDEQLDRLQTEYVDLLLLHWPVNERYVTSWRVLEDLYRAGKAKAIGVSNFDVERLQILLREATITPAVNQIEFNPRIHQPEVVKFCRDHGIRLEAWSPLGNGAMLNNPTIAQIAAAHGKTSAQIILRWVHQHDVIPLTKTSHPARMAENLAIFDFELTPAEMAAIDDLDEEVHAIWYDTFKWSGNLAGIDDYIATPGRA